MRYAKELTLRLANRPGLLRRTSSILQPFRRLGARSMIAVPLLNRMKMADGAFDWDGYALVGIAPGLYKKETGGRREGSCAVRWQSLQENFPATCWLRIQVWVRRDSKAKADWRQRGP